MEQQASNLLGEKYTFEVNFLQLVPYATYEWPKDHPGAVAKGYYEGFIYQLERFLNSMGEDGKKSLNEAVTTKKVTLEIDESGKFSYCGCDIKDGVFRILSAENYLGTNVSDACEYIVKAVEAAEEAKGGGGLSVSAKANVKATVEKEFPDLEKQFAEILGYKVTLDANLEANFAKLKGSSFNESYFGTATLEYYKGFIYQLEYLKFKGDEMMQEAFQEADSKATIRLEVVDELQNGAYYNDVLFKDGICAIQVFHLLPNADPKTVPNYWYTNTGDVGSKVVDRL